MRTLVIFTSPCEIAVSVNKHNCKYIVCRKSIAELQCRKKIESLKMELDSSLPPLKITWGGPPPRLSPGNMQRRCGILHSGVECQINTCPGFITTLHTNNLTLKAKMRCKVLL
ncbi:hypothetical protein KIL84_019226 [Mauremys mutica]|uniref:Uncharacterized protein n=1 Tax=Mauremys mutica TaxID=74926 RepID=A0A9D4B361_9SAUR|nr:hypothetical protein KIL84_019226 [Mauremys mutica]